MRSRERFIRKLLSRLYNLNLNRNDNRGLVVLLSMFKKTSSPLETFPGTTPPHNYLLSKAESSTRNCGGWTRNCGALGVQGLQQDGRQQRQGDTTGGGSGRGGFSVSNSMAHKRYKRPKNNIVINPVVNMQARMQWTNLPPNHTPAFLLHRSFSDTMVFQHTTSTSNMCFRRNASSGEFSGRNGPQTPSKNRKCPHE